VNSSTETEHQLETASTRAATPQGRAVSAPSPKRRYGVLSLLRSFLIFDPIIWSFTLVLGVASVPASLFGDRERILHWFARAWSWLIMKTIWSPVKVIGMEKVDTSKAMVYALNHASALDIPVLYTYLPFQFRILFKSELLSYPIIGWHLRRAGQLCINQQSPSKSIGSVKKGLQTLKDGMPIVIFPEGGRTPDGEIKPLMPGALFLAIRAKVDVVPVALVGTFELLPMNTYHIKSRPLEMIVGEPIPTTGYTMRDLGELSDRVKAAMEDLYYPRAETQDPRRAG
jgi:1-acyl-sn-glycerol-3-phosphate acyltransferase